MYTCPECGAKTDGINRNERGLRCTACLALLDPALAVAQDVQTKDLAETKTAQAVKAQSPGGTVKDSYSARPKAEKEPEVEPAKAQTQPKKATKG
jgi:hypothetical protein